MLNKLNTLRDYLVSNILGQDEPITEIVEAVQRSMLGFRYPNRPIASMLLMGPTGVGKTESVNLFTQHLFEDEKKFIRLDMSEFMNQNALGLLIGNRVGERGLFGHYYNRSGGEGTILFDEIEKAHPLVIDIFLQILSAGRFTLASGDTLDLSKYIVAATTNIGSRVLMASRSTDRETIVKRTLQAVQAEMRPETFGRFDLGTVFGKLDWKTLNAIAAFHLRKSEIIINNLGNSIKYDYGVIEHVFREGYSEEFGARPMQNAAMRILGDVVSRQGLSNGWPVTGLIQYDQRTNTCTMSEDEKRNVKGET